MLKDNIDLNGKTILVTGVAGFIGSNLAKRLLRDYQTIRVVGIDNMNDYYDVHIKESRLKELSPNPNFIFIKGNIADKQTINELFEAYHPQIVVNLAAQAGVRYSIINPDAYIESNLLGFYNILEACRHSYDYGESGVLHLVYASSSSVYGSNKKIPYSTDDKVDNPVSLYAATKKSNELMAHAYSKLYNIPSTGLRFFTVYGPAGRPDMAYFGFTDKLRAGKTIQIFNYGNCRRDFTYIDDIAEGVLRVIDRAPVADECWKADSPDPATSCAPYRLYNIGNSHPVRLIDFIEAIEEAIGRKAKKNFLPMQPGDVYQTYADTTDLQADFGFKPDKSVRDGVKETIDWFRKFYKL